MAMGNESPESPTPTPVATPWLLCEAEMPYASTSTTIPKR